MPKVVQNPLSIRRAVLEADEFYTACEYDRGCAPDTIGFYRKKITPFLQWVQGAGVEGIDGDAVRRFFRYLKDKGLSDNGRHVYLRALRTWFNFLVRRKVIPGSPLPDADLEIHPVRGRPDLPKAERFHRLLVQMKADIFSQGAKEPNFVSLRDYALILWYAESGARRSEGLVSTDDLDLQFGTAQTVQKVRREAKTRTLYFQAIRHLMKFYLEEREKHLRSLGKEDVRTLWVTDDGEPLTPDAVSHIFARIKRRCGWEGRFHPQKIRALAATMAALNGDRTMLEIRMGWAPGTPVARRYINLAQEYEAVAEAQAAMSPLRALARLRRPRAVD